MIPLFKVRMSHDASYEVSKVLSSGFIGQGPKVEEFEDLLWKELRCETRPVTVNSCTSAIDLALHLCGVGHGDEVISTSQTCLGFNSPVLLADGSTKKIGHIVNQKYDGLVKSYNEKTGKYEDKKIYNWIKVPVETDNWYRLTLKNKNAWGINSTRTVQGIWITGDHKVLSKRGWVRVDQLTSDDVIATNYYVPNNEQTQFINGMMLGDASVQRTKTHQSYRFTTCHTKKHDSYVIHTKDVLRFKGSLLERPQRVKDGIVVSDACLVYQSYSGNPWKEVFENWYTKNSTHTINNKRKIVPKDLELTPITLAAWYMDDGNFNNRETRSLHFSTEGFSYECFWRLFYKMVDFGFKPTAVKKSSGYCIRLGERYNDVDKFFKLVSKYILPCFRYKVPSGYDEFDPSSWDLGEPELYFSTFELTREIPGPHNVPNFAYCLDVEDNHNFVSNKILVHNCLASNIGPVHRGATIRWADIDPITGLIDPDSVKKLITKNTKAIIAVNWAGRLCDYEKLKSFGIPVIEDAAHTWDVYNPSFGVRGDYVCYSFQAIKFLTTGDGGLLICPNKEKEEEARILRWFGLDRTKGQSFRCSQMIEKVGFKYHMNDIAAAIGIWNISEARNSVYMHMINSKYIIENVNNPNLILPSYDPTCSFWLFSLHVLNNRKQDFIMYMEDCDIAASPVHHRNDLYPCMEKYKESSLIGVEQFNRTQVSIPNGWWLTQNDRDYIVDKLNKF